MALMMSRKKGGRELTTGTTVFSVVLPYTVNNCKKGDIIFLEGNGSSAGPVTNATVLAQGSDTGAGRFCVAVKADSDGTVSFTGGGSVSGVLIHLM